MKLKHILQNITESGSDYKTWKRKTVTLRGMKIAGKDNEVYGSFGKGLYTVPLSNASMAKQYGTVYFVVNGHPKKPKVVNSLNEAELVRQKLINDFCEKHNTNYSPQFFESKTSMDVEMMAIGYDGLVIKGREIVNYDPKDVKYFKTESELMQYYNESV